MKKFLAKLALLSIVPPLIVTVLFFFLGMRDVLIGNSNITGFNFLNLVSGIFGVLFLLIPIYLIVISILLNKKFRERRFYINVIVMLITVILASLLLFSLNLVYPRQGGESWDDIIIILYSVYQVGAVFVASIVTGIIVLANKKIWSKK